MDPSNSKPVPHITPEPISHETVVAAEVVTSEPVEAISAFDLLEQADPELVRQSVAPVSSALLEEIQELDPLEVREGSDQPHIAPQLPVEIKPTVTISRQFEGRLIYKKPFFRRPGIRSSSNSIPTTTNLWMPMVSRSPTSVSKTSRLATFSITLRRTLFLTVLLRKTQKVMSRSFKNYSPEFGIVGLFRVISAGIIIPRR